MSIRIIVIDLLSNENKYRQVFWKDHRQSFDEVQVDIPEPINGMLVKESYPDGTYLKFDISGYDLVIIHERDDSAGYEGNAERLGKKTVLYSDAFSETPEFNEDFSLMKIKAEIFYRQLPAFLGKVNNNPVIDLTGFSGRDEEYEKFLAPFEKLLPVEECWNENIARHKKDLLDYLKK